MKYLPALDGLRALACLAVVAGHAEAPGFNAGFLGVDLFFVLSGYLITRLLAEKVPSLSKFYMRRLQRLTPALAVMLATYIVVFPLLVPNYPHARDAAIAIIYMSDYAKAWAWLPYWVGHTWSLSVEEHFYLVWPLLFYRFHPGLKTLAIAFVCLTLWRMSQSSLQHWYFAFDTRATGLVLGCLIAGLPRDRFPAWPGLLGFALAVVFMNLELAQGPALTLVELSVAIAVLGNPPQWLKARALVYLGKLSYGIYLWHYPITLLCREAKLGWVETLAWSLGLSVLLATLSYHTVEAWFRRGASQSQSLTPGH